MACPSTDNTTVRNPVTVASEGRSKLATKWFERAGKEYQSADFTEAEDSIKKAQDAAREDVEVKLLSARISLARLNFKDVLSVLDGVDGSEAAALRARAAWYTDDLTRTSEEINKALEDPDYKDPWAKPIRELTTQGAGRKPFVIRDNSTRLVELKMPRDFGLALTIPCEIDGQQTLALVVTGVPEVILDSKSRSSPAWISLRFANGAQHIEVRDVPALPQDISQYTGAQGTAAIGALIGTNLLRRLHITVDRRADQFILRREEAAPPPSFSRIPLSYVRGGAMVTRATVKRDMELSGGASVDTGLAFNFALINSAWAKLGVNAKELPTFSGLAHGRLNNVRLGAQDMGAFEALANIPNHESKLKAFDLEMIGTLGAGFWASVRATLADGGRALWVETDEDTPTILAPQIPSGGVKEPLPVTSPSSSPAPTSSSR